jgi:O-antigen ligase
MTLFGYKISRQNIDEILLIVVSTSVFLPLKISSIILIIAAIIFLLDRNLALKLKQLVSNKFGLLVIGFYGIHIFSAFFSYNSHESFLILERRLSFLLFPLLLLGQTSSTTIKKVCTSFALACQVALLICFVGAFWLFLNSNDWGVFFYHRFSSILGLNAIYLSIYSAFSLFVLLYYYESFGSAQRRISIVSMAFLLCSLILLSSKMVLFVTLLGVVLFFVLELKSRKQKWNILLGVLIFFAIILMIKPVRQRFEIEFNSKTEVLKLNQYKYDTPFTGLTLRLVFWKICYEIINERHAWISGVGIGDYQDLLNQKYIEKGMYTGNKQFGDTGYIGYGPHNQWVETLFSMGIIGLAYFIWFISFIIHHYVKGRNVLALLFILIFVLVSMTECVLSVNKGIVFFAFFICLFNGYNCIEVSSNDKNG